MRAEHIDNYLNDKPFAENIKVIVNMTDEEALRRKTAGEYLTVMEHTPEVITKNVKGAANVRIIMRFDAAYLETRHDGILDGNYHNYGEDFADNLVSVLKNPDAIIRLENGRINLFGQIAHKKGGTSIASVELNAVKDTSEGHGTYNLVVTMTPAKNNYVKNLVKKAVSVEYEKENLPQVNPQLHESLSSINGKFSNNRIAQRTEESNPSGEKNSTQRNAARSVEETDAEYMDAVKRGDMETAQRMVEEAAKAAGARTFKNGKVRHYYHGTTKAFTSFAYEKARRGNLSCFAKPISLSLTQAMGGSQSTPTPAGQTHSASILTRTAAFTLTSTAPETETRSRRASLICHRLRTNIARIQHLYIIVKVLFFCENLEERRDAHVEVLQPKSSRQNCRRLHDPGRSKGARY